MNTFTDNKYFSENTVLNKTIKLSVEVIIGLVILICLHFISMRVRSQIKKHNSNTKNVGVELFADAVYYGIMVLGIYFLLVYYGFQVTGIIAIITAFSFAIGLSLQGTMSDFASGIVLSFFSPYKIGDIIKINDITGKVIDFTIINTIIEDVPSKILINVPNSKIQGNIIENMSRSNHIFIITDVKIDSNKNDAITVINAIKAEFSNFVKYPFILKDVPFTVNVSDMSSSEMVPGTVIKVRIPTIPVDVPSKTAIINNNLKAVLTKIGVVMP